MSKPNKILFMDLETQNHPYFGAVASPRHPENYTVMVGQAIDETPFSGERVLSHYQSKEEASNWLRIPDDVWLLVAHNAPFELDWMLVQQRAEILRFLKRGGKVFCTAYAHYLLSNQQDTYPSLDEIAPIYGGSHKVDGIKALWNQGVLTADIDPELLAEYLIGPRGDIENTRRVFYGEYQKLVERGMWKMALERMEGMLFCAFAMDSGLKVDRDVAFAQLRKGEERITELRQEFEKFRAGFPAEVEFKESSDFHMSAWLFGGPLKYKARVPRTDASGEFIMEKVDCYQFGEVLIPVEQVPIDSEAYADAIFKHGPALAFKAGKNKGMPKVVKMETDQPQMKWGELLHECPGVVPLSMFPSDIKEQFDKEFTGKRTLADGSPVYSTGADALEVVSKRPELSEGQRNVILALLEFAKLDKDLGTYYLREKCDEDGNVIKQSGMLQYLTDDNFVYHILNMTATVTTRLSSNRP